MRFIILSAAIFILVILIGIAVWKLCVGPKAVSLPPNPRTVEQVIEVLGDSVDQSLRPKFERSDAPYPPSRLVLIGFKEERRLDVLAPDADGKMCEVLSYPILAASGGPGPKREEGDLQVPEGIYRIELLNPNSRFHLSLRVNYPNPDDIARAEGRDIGSLGGDIMIHGGTVSTGCLAVGDRAVEELFVVVHRVGLDNVTLILAPRDLRTAPGRSALDRRIHDALREIEMGHAGG